VWGPKKITLAKIMGREAMSTSNIKQWAVSPDLRWGGGETMRCASILRTFF
jgi:hypothetical protein